jgi:UTP--glucose-1-phosphate uridylyltransferase
MVTAPGKGVLEDHFGRAIELESFLSARGKLDALASIRDEFPTPEHISFTRQDDPMGLGHAVWCAHKLVGDEPFAVLLPDDLMKASPGCLAQMVEAYEKTGGHVLAVEEVPLENTSRYGILNIEKDDGRLASVKGLIEKPDPIDAPSRLAIIGRYILQPDVFKHLDKKVSGAGGEIQLTDAIAATIGDVPIHGLRIDGRRYDCGTKLGFVEANVAFAAERDDLGGDIYEILNNSR